MTNAATFVLLILVIPIVVAVVANVISHLAVKAIDESGISLARGVVRIAAFLVPSGHHERYRDEWLGEVQRLETTPAMAFWTAVRILLFAPSTWRELRGWAPGLMPAPTDEVPGAVSGSRSPKSTHPWVVAVVVNHNGMAFLPDTIRGLHAQTRPVDDVLVIDTGSTDGSAEWARLLLGDDAVLIVKGPFGRAVKTALRYPRTWDADWLWLLHDDSAPEPEALEQLLAEAEYRPSASILGPKLVSWTNPDRILEVGFSVDRTGRAVSLVEDDDELDHGQYDQVRDVFYVNTAGMLVRRGPC